jgi:serine/threonine-protein kinase HipA
MRALDVFRDDRIVGQLRDADGEIEFEYAPVYLGDQPNPISASLPLDPPLIRGARARAFFGNLLPEGDVRTALSRQYKLDAGDDIGLLAKIGADCAGALVILPEGERPLPANAAFEQRYLLLEDEYEFGQYIEVLAMSPTATFMGVPTRLSLAGAQSKTALARFGGARLYRSLGGATTHIVKFGGQLDARGGEIFPGVVFNEYFCSKLAQACNIPIRPVELLPYRLFRDGPPEYVFCIERYDRQIRRHTVAGQPQHRVIRLQQEDFCQALGRPRAQKYEAHDGVTLSEMFRFAGNPDQVAVPAVARRDLLNLVLLNLAIGNRDSHAKNYSLLRRGLKAELAPAYDLVCTEVYQNVDRTLPQKIGTAETLHALSGADLERFAEAIVLPPAAVRRELARTCTALAKQLPKVRAELEREPFADRAEDIVQKIAAVIGRNCEKLAAVG